LDIEIVSSVSSAAALEAAELGSADPTLFIVDDEPVDEPSYSDSLFPRPAPEAAPSSTIERNAALSTPARPRGRLWRFGATTLLSLVLFVGGLVAARPYLPREYVPRELADTVERWVEQVERLPRALRDRGALLDFPKR
jgi:hypothetical protein